MDQKTLKFISEIVKPAALAVSINTPSTPSGRRTTDTIDRLNDVKNIIPIMVNANVLKF